MTTTKSKASIAQTARWQREKKQGIKRNVGRPKLTLIGKVVKRVRSLIGA